MKLFVDDIRLPQIHFDGWMDPEEVAEWVVVRDPHEAWQHICSGEVTHVSFDNDLGLIRGTMTPTKEGWELLRDMVELIRRGDIPRPEVIWIHTSNPVARKRMEGYLSDLEKLY